MNPTKLKPGCGVSTLIARMQFSRGAMRSMLQRKQYRARGFAYPHHCHLYEVLAWRRLGELVSRTSSRSMEARWAIRRRYGKAERPAPKFHPTFAERMQRAIAQHHFRKRRATGECA